MAPEWAPSPAAWLAATAGSTVGAAVDVLETARRLETQPDVDETARKGLLSTVEVRDIAEAAEADPSATRTLLDAAPVEGVRGLHDRCRQVKAAAMSAEQERARHERIHRDRSWCGWTDRDGTACRQLRTTPEAAARIDAALEAEASRISREARADGRESHEAHMADALLALADRKTAGSHSAKYRALARVDVKALRNGTTESGEICEIRGVGPIDVGTARNVLGDALLSLVITDGVDVLNVTRLGRRHTAEMHDALDWMFTECAVAGCHRSRGLEDHHLVPYAETGHTTLNELVPLCGEDHDLITYDGHRLERRPDGQYELVPPSEASGESRGPPVAA